MYKTESFKPDTFKPARFESDGKITLSGKEIPYHTICEDNVIYGPDGNPVASIFTYAYFRSDVEDTSNRPVVFAYNGGPGSSCMYVHAGFLGTRRMQYDEVDRESAFGPYKVIDNPDCLIDIADIVLIDPVGTGYGVLIDESKKKDFFGIEQDAEALLTVLEAWVRRYNRHQNIYVAKVMDVLVVQSLLELLPQWEEKEAMVLPLMGLCSSEIQLL